MTSAEPVEAEEMRRPVMMRFEICVPVLPAYVQHYLDDGWTIAEGEE